MDAVNMMGRQIKKVAELTADKDGFGAAKLVVFANIPEDNPFMAGAFLGQGEPGTVINIGVSGPGVIKRAIERLVEGRTRGPRTGRGRNGERTSFRVTRWANSWGGKWRRGWAFRSAWWTCRWRRHRVSGIAWREILQAMGISAIGAAGSTAAVALLNDAVKKGGSFASSSVGGLSGAFIPVSEDQALSRAVADGSLTLRNSKQ